jgi:isocitrate/isopropylmalate dehydrogenase
MCVPHPPDLTWLVEKEYDSWSVCLVVSSVMMTSAKGNERNADAISDSTENVVSQSYSFPQLYFNDMTNQFVLKLC